MVRLCNPCIHLAERPAIVLRRFTFLALLGTGLLMPSLASAQTRATTGSATGGTAAAQPTGAAADAGSRLTSQNVFSETGDGLGQIGANEGRFATSTLANQPTAGGNTSAANQARNAQNQFRNLQRLNQQFNRGNQQNRFGSSGTRLIRPSLRLGFTAQPRPAEEMKISVGRQFAALQTRLSRISDRGGDYSAVKFTVGDKGEVVLSGNVPSEAAGRVVASILRMEPGVRSVRNELKVAE